MKGLNKLQLDLISERGCSTPGCNHMRHDKMLFFHSRCHPGSGVEAAYDGKQGLMQLRCRECHAPVVDVRPQDDTTINIFVAIEGGVVRGVSGDGAVHVHVIDYDRTSDPNETVFIPHDDGHIAKAVVTGPWEVESLSPARVEELKQVFANRPMEQL